MEVAIIGGAALVYRYGPHRGFHIGGGLALGPLVGTSILLLAATVFLEQTTACDNTAHSVEAILPGLRVAYAIYVVAESSYPALVVHRRFEHAVAVQLGILIMLFAGYMWTAEWVMVASVVLAGASKCIDMWLHVRHAAGKPRA